MNFPLQEIDNQVFMTSVSRLELGFKKKELWPLIQHMYQFKHIGANGYSWPDDVYIPASKWKWVFDNNLQKIISRENKLDLDSKEIRTALLIGLINIGTWRYSMGCYYLAPDLYPLTKPNPINTHITPQIWDNFKEWSICVPTPGLTIGNKDVANMFVTKNAEMVNKKTFKNLLISFQFKYQNHCDSTMPYAVIETNANGAIEDAIMDSGGFNQDTNILEILGTAIAILNTIFCKASSIESNIVGIQPPRYTNVQLNINPNTKKNIFIKHLAPSNLRLWFVGSNILVDHNQRLRNQPTQHINLVWEFENNRPNLILKSSDF